MVVIASILAGIIGGAVVTFVIARRVVHRPKLCVRVEPTLVLFPADLDVHDRLAFSVGGHNVDNLCALAVEVVCKGQKDVVVPDAAPPRGPNATPLPRIDFDDFRIIGIRTLNNDASRFYIALGRRANNRGIHLNIHRLRAGATARFQVVGELEGGRRQFDADQCRVFPGAIPDVDFVTSGKIARPWLTQ
jgi:hypothetical protein